MRLEPPGFFFLLYFFFGRYPTHHCHIGMKTASTTDYTVVWALDTLYIYILPTNTFILTAYKGQRWHLGLKEMAGGSRRKCILRPRYVLFFFFFSHLDYNNDYLLTVDTYGHHHHWSIGSSYCSARKQQQQQGLETVHLKPPVQFF